MVQRRAAGGAVASGHELTTEAACEILEAGGNAFDAAVAGGFASAVTEPAFTSLGGGGFLLARTETGESTLFDFFVDTPGKGLDIPLGTVLDFTDVDVKFESAVQTFHVGRGSIAGPGVLKGLLHVHRKLGVLPLQEVLKPAIKFAKEGFLVNQTMAHAFSLLVGIFTLSQTGRDIFCENGTKSLPVEGDIFTNKDLQSFLSSLSSNGEAAFYSGAIAERIVDDICGFGILTLDDLRSYRVIEREPLEFWYRGAKIYTNPLPSLGGVLIKSLLQRFEERYRPSKDGFEWGNQKHVETMASVMKEVEEHRDNIIDQARMEADAPFAKVECSRGTTHISVVDSAGNVASMTTSNGEGSGYIVPSTGVQLNNMLGEDDIHPHGFDIQPAGVRVTSMMAPTLVVLDEAQNNILVCGSGGSKRIRTALFQTIVNAVDFQLPLKDCVALPRLHFENVLHVEPGYPSVALQALNQTFHGGQLNIWERKNLYFGGTHCVTQREAVGDSRRCGCGKVV